MHIVKARRILNSRYSDITRAINFDIAWRNFLSLFSPFLHPSFSHLSNLFLSIPRNIRSFFFSRVSNAETHKVQYTNEPTAR